ncbi:MAG: DEAD/DEAH box helicase [Sandaracinus sp.]|nr:DEAD/DEAH box helicase [Sandaracinus sp.]MCB9633187.1 DEAD/DEAH box helicase [Sandaracinus sp.]
MKFDELGLATPLLRAVSAAGYESPTPIQVQAIPPALAGRDVLGIAQTGTGKTAAFALPILQRLDAIAQDDTAIRALILTPTRELAAQIGESFETYGKKLDLFHTVIFGGVKPNPQIRELREGVDVLVATPGRLLDLIGQGEVDLTDLAIFVLDEADRMLDMGFIHDVKRVVKLLPKKKQTLFFSATMPPDIVELANGLLVDPVRVEVTPVSSTAERIDQFLYFVDKGDKRRLLVDVLKDPKIEHTLVFSRTKHGANRIVEYLEKAGIPSAAIHGNKSQNARERALEAFKSKQIRVLVATDIAARGIDIDGISHVLNFDLPNVPETYVHRIGRTGRAGASGIAISFCDDEERAYLRDIERLIGKHVDRVTDHPYPPVAAPPAATELSPKKGASAPTRSEGSRSGSRPGGGGGGRPGGRSGGGRPGGRGGRPQGERSQGGRPPGERSQGGERPRGEGAPSGEGAPKRRRRRGGRGRGPSAGGPSAPRD